MAASETGGESGPINALRPAKMIRGATPRAKSSSARSTRALAIRPSVPSGRTPRPRTTIASVLPARRFPASIIVELFPVARLTGIETLAIARASTVIGELEIPP